jgi:dUTP pyrophosphatase
MKKLKFKKLHPDAVLPRKAHAADAGFDLTITEADWDVDYGLWVLKTGLAVAIPEGYVGLLTPRSSITKTTFRLANSIGIVDSGYFGEIIMKFDVLPNTSDAHRKPYMPGAKAGQLIIMKLPHFEAEWADELGESERGTGSFGSSGA